MECAKPQAATKLVSQAGKNVNRRSLKLSASRIIDKIDNIALLLNVNFTCSPALTCKQAGC